MKTKKQKRNFVQLITLTRKEIDRLIRIWAQSLLPPVITTALYFIIFGQFIGPHIPKIQGVNYIDFIVPGLVMMSVLTNAYLNVVSSFFIARFQHSIEEILVSPTPNWIILIGYIAGGIMRGLIVGIIVLFIAEFFTNLRVEHPLMMIMVFFLTTIMFSLGGLINAIFARRFDDLSIVPTFILQPLTYLGGVFYSVNNLPEFWQIVSRFNPIFYLINTFRYSMIGISDFNPNVAVTIMIIFVVVLFVSTLYLLNKGVGIRT